MSLQRIGERKRICKTHQKWIIHCIYYDSLVILNVENEFKFEWFPGVPFLSVLKNTACLNHIKDFLL